MATELTFSRLIDEAARRKFESAWSRGQPQPIESFLPAEGNESYLPTLEELVQIELEFSWKAQGVGPQHQSQLPHVEDYLTRFPQLKEPDILVRLLQQECLVRGKWGAALTAAELSKRFPQLATRVLKAEGTDVSAGIPTKTSSQPPTDPAQDDMQRYDLLTEHGRGGFGSVWRASDGKLGRQVALKQLSSRLTDKPEFRLRFAREARIAARLEHPGIVPVYDVGNVAGGRPFYTMKFIQGQTLSDAIRQFHELPRRAEARRLALIKLLNYFLAITRTIEYAHSRGVVHRDLKPQNVVLGDFGEAYVVDWGLAKVLDEGDPSLEAAAPAVDNPRAVASDTAMTLQGTVQGTPAYMSPEQAAGNVAAVDQRSDIYSLGTILYQLLTGKLPFQGDSSQGILEQLQTAEPPRPRAGDRHIPRALEAICLQAMAKRREDRYACVGDLTRDLERYLADEPVSVWREPLLSRLGRWGRRRRTLVVACTVALILMICGGGILTFNAERAALRLEESLRGDQALALAEIHAGRLESAETLLTKAVERLSPERRFSQLKQDLATQRDRVRSLIRFWGHADHAWFQAGEERETESLEAATAALVELGVKDDQPEWWLQLPVVDLTQEQRTAMADEVHRLYLLRASLLTKTAVMKFADPVGVKDCQEALVSLRQAQRHRASNFSKLLENFCYFRLAQTDKVTSLKGIEPSDPDDYFFFGFIYIWIGQYPDNDESKLVRMMVRNLFGLEFDKPMEKGQAYFKKAAELQPGRFWHHFMVGWAQSATRDFGEAALAFTTCVALRPNYPPGYVGRGTMKIRQGRADGDQALIAAGFADLDFAVKLDPQDSWTYWMRGQLSDKPRLDESLRDYQRAMELERPTSRATYRVIHLEDICSELLKQGPGRADVHATLAWAHWRRGGVDEALESARQSLLIDGQNAAALIIRGRVHLLKKEWEAGLTDFQTALSKMPESFAAAAGVAEALEGLGRFQEALVAYDELRNAAGKLDWQIAVATAGRERVLKQLRPSAAAE